MKFKLPGATLLLLWASLASADWVLDNDESVITFTSTKANTAAEVHSFLQLSGGIDPDGMARVTIDLGSVDTSIEIRDERMRELLFETDQYPTATILASFDPDVLAALDSGSSASMTVSVELAIHGSSNPLPAEVRVIRLTGDRILVASEEPVIVTADQLNLAAGLEALREIAGLPSISPAVPVTFVLAFDAE